MNVRRVHLLSMTSALVLTAFASAGFAGHNPCVQVAVHVLPHNDLRTCSRDFPEIDSCGDIETTYAGCGGVDIFPVFFDVSEYKGVLYGLTWTGSESCVFTGCSDLQIGHITEPGDGVAQAWYSCRPGYTVVPGFAWIDVSEPGFAAMVPFEDTGTIEVLDCADGIDHPIVNCRAGLCGESGDPAIWLRPSMGLDKTGEAGSDCVNGGDTLVYTISYENPYWEDIGNVAIVDYLPAETEYVSASDAGTYDAGMHTVVWQVGTVPVESTGSVELTVWLRPDSAPPGAVLNTCEIRTGDYTIRAAWDSTQTCYTSTKPTTWSGIKSMFR